MTHFQENIIELNSVISAPFLALQKIIFHLRKIYIFLRTRTKRSFPKDIFSLTDKNHFKIFKSIIINDNRARQQRRFIYLIFTVSIMPGSINSTGLEHLSRCSNKNDQRGSLIIGVWDILNLHRKGGGSRGQDHLLSTETDVFN